MNNRAHPRMQIPVLGLPFERSPSDAESRRRRMQVQQDSGGLHKTKFSFHETYPFHYYHRPASEPAAVFPWGRGLGRREVRGGKAAEAMEGGGGFCGESKM